MYWGGVVSDGQLTFRECRKQNLLKQNSTVNGNQQLPPQQEKKGLDMYYAVVLVHTYKLLARAGSF